MTKIFIALAIIFACANAASMKWNDEFNGAAIDTKKWNIDIATNVWGDQEVQYYTNKPTNLIVRNGMVTLKANKEVTNGKQFSSASINTKGLFDFKYGKVEARIMVPSGSGSWPGFSLIGSNVTTTGYPACGEIAIMEYFGNDTSNIYSSIHSTGANVTKSLTGPDWSKAFHVYGAEWTDSSVRFFVNGKTVGNVTVADDATWPFNLTNFFIGLNLAVGPGAPDAASVFPKQMIIDWVRVYQ